MVDELKKEIEMVALVQEMDHQIQILRQELKDAASTVSSLLMQMSEYDQTHKEVTQFCQDLNSDLAHLEKKVAKYIPGFDQVNCRKCGKRLVQDSKTCPFCSVPNPVGI